MRLADGTLAGSTLTMDRALRNLVDVSACRSTTPRGACRPTRPISSALADRGRLKPGAWADVVVLDRDLQVQDVFIEGGVSMSRMLDEAREAPAAVARQLAARPRALAGFGARLRRAAARVAADDRARQLRPRRALRGLPGDGAARPAGDLDADVARHAVPVEDPLQGLASLAFSQSGQSPDLVGPTEYFRNCGALTCAFVNDPASPLAQAAEWLFPLHCRPGAERGRHQEFHRAAGRGRALHRGLAG